MVNLPQALADFDFLVWLFRIRTPKDFSIIWFSNPSTMRAHNEGQFRNASRALNLISTFLLLSRDRYIC